MVNERKGISPLVAVVALIGITLIISGILTSYATRFTTERLYQLQECTDASVIIQGARYQSGTLSLYVKNRGDINLDFDVLITKNSGEIWQAGGPFNTTAGQLTTFSVVDQSGHSVSDTREATIQAKECSNVQDFIAKNFITGL
ncbi:MAG: archaellin/type IV pilin N-terminal domain-containing protein [Candidatus Thorarchaeota archaeon]|jgi:FlaG/FlaF family flagellin (archaellin)